jgi:3-oxoadipate enol-lactonase
MWMRQIPAFSGVRRVVTIDLPGHGGSVAAEGEYRLEDLGRDVLEVADSAGIDRFDLAGISLGGLISLWLGIVAPDRVLTLVASNTAARVATSEFWSERMSAVAELGMEGIRSSVLPRFFTPDFPGRDPETFRSVESVFTSVDPIGYAGCCAALRDADLRDRVSEIRCPTLIVVGDQDLATPPTDGEFLSGRISGSRLAVIAGAAHLANLDQPEAFTSAVQNVWNEW